MKKLVPVDSASALIDEKIKELGDWRGKTLAKVREIVREADPEIVEEWKWRGTPVWSHGGIVCTGETYKNVVKMTFAKGAALEDPSGLFNSSLEGNVRRAIDIHEGDKVDAAALKDLIRAAVALNLTGKSKPKPRRASRKRDDGGRAIFDNYCGAWKPRACRKPLPVVDRGGVTAPVKPDRFGFHLHRSCDPHLMDV